MTQKPLGGSYDCSYKEAGFLAEVEQEFLFMAGLETTKGMTVSYPYVSASEEEDKGYEWYTKNHSHNSPKGDSPRERKYMVTLEHLKGFEEINEDVYRIQDFALPVKPGEGQLGCVWIAGYSLHSSQEEKLKKLLPKNTKIEKEKSWLQQ